jgi:stage II sporulation protein D
VETTSGANGEISSLVLRGGGYGHGIGMCQFGAMGRARAGQDYKTILTTYYPGTTVGRVD